MVLSQDEAKIPMAKPLLHNHSDSLAAVQVHRTAPKIASYFPKGFLRTRGGPAPLTDGELKKCELRALAAKTQSVNKHVIQVDAALVGMSKRRKTFSAPKANILVPAAGAVDDLEDVDEAVLPGGIQLSCVNVICC